MVTLTRRIPTPPLLEPGAPLWAVRFAARLNEFFKLRHPQAPSELYGAPPAEFPPAADWPAGSLVYGTDGKLYMTDGATWLAIGPGGPSGVPEAPNDGQYYSRRNLAWAVPPAQTDGVTPPLFDGDTSLATTAFVQRALGNFTTAVFLAASVGLTAGDAGKLIVAGAAVTLTLPLANSVRVGAGYFVVSATSGVVTIAASGGNTVFDPVGGGVASVPLAQGRSLFVISDGGGSWFIAGNGVQAVTPPQFSNSAAIATTAFIHNAGPNFNGVAFYGVNTALAPSAAGGLSVANAAGITLTLPLGTAVIHGATFWIQNASAAAITVAMAAGNNVYRIGGYVASFSLASGKGVAVMQNAGTDWYTWGDVL